jgi:hypothetical protein
MFFRICSPCVFDIEGHFPANVIDDGLGDTNTARLSKGFKSSRDVHPVAVNIIAVGDDIAEVEPTRNSMRLSCGTSAFRSIIAR